MSHLFYKPAKSRLHRSELAVPGSNPKMFEKALKSNSDYIFLDLEDAVSPNDKIDARRNVINAIKEYKEQITKLKKEINDSISEDDWQQLNSENSILRSEIKLSKEKNTEAENTLKEWRFLIDEKQKEIDKLLYIKDTGHHG